MVTNNCKCGECRTVQIGWPEKCQQPHFSLKQSYLIGFNSTSFGQALCPVWETKVFKTEILKAFPVRVLLLGKKVASGQTGEFEASDGGRVKVSRRCELGKMIFIDRKQ